MVDDLPVIPIAQNGCGGRLRIQAILGSADQGASLIGNVVTVCGWSRTVRKQGGGHFCFVSLTDGSTVECLQVIVDKAMSNYEELLKCGVCCSFRFVGEVVKSPAAGQSVELAVKDSEKHSFLIYGTADQSKYPLSKKQHGREFLREHAHLRPRTFLFGACTRIRSQMALATHMFFHGRGFQYIHTPIITAADCEGAGEMFQVTTLLGDKATDVPVTKSGDIDYSKDFFAKKSFLTVSGQLAVENFCCSLSDVYTFGPTFRAENSHTSRHLAEFWMIEPEMAFAELEDLMDVAESYLKYCVNWALSYCKQDVQWFDKHVEEGLVERLQNIVAEPFARVTYTEALEILEKAPVSFDVKPFWGVDLGAEHERYLTDVHFKKPVVAYNYPRDFKAFYMKQNDDDKTVRSLDILLPKIGEVIGGSQREDNLERLDALIKQKGLEPEPYWWYRELRQYGSVPHSGFGLGFERLLMLVTGLDNIRDVIPFPRYPGHAEF